jgi:hypothetical protein
MIAGHHPVSHANLHPIPHCLAAVLKPECATLSAQPKPIMLCQSASLDHFDPSNGLDPSASVPLQRVNEHPRRWDDNRPDADMAHQISPVDFIDFGN